MKLRISNGAATIDVWPPIANAHGDRVVHPSERSRSLGVGGKDGHTRFYDFSDIELPVPLRRERANAVARSLVAGAFEFFLTRSSARAAVGIDSGVGGGLARITTRVHYWNAPQTVTTMTQWHLVSVATKSRLLVCEAHLDL